MWTSIVLVLLTTQTIVEGLWENEKLCPIQCSCRLQHITEAPIYRYTQQDKEAQKHESEAFGHGNNEVLYDEDFLANFEEDKSILRSATCILNTETDVKTLLDDLQNDVNSLTLIQGSDSGNKTVKISDLVKFRDLYVLELQGFNLNEQGNVSKFICEVDGSLPWLEYLNLERVTLRNALKRIRILDDANEEFTLEYVQKLSPNSKPISFIKKGPPTEVLPYKEYVEQLEHNFASFKGFKALSLLRISDCDLNTLYWEIFEGLTKLDYLILERNNLKFIPDFAFYGAPSVKTLSLAHNNLLNIQITDLAGLLELEYLDLSYNNFTQLSELSLPPFPKLKLANFGFNPITVVFPNTFEVLNTTDSIILGSDDTTLSILPNCFVGLKLLKKLAIRNLKIPMLHREILVGMPNLKELILTGDIPKIEFDAFSELSNLEKLIANECNISLLSIDSFMGLNRLKILDLSRNNLDFIPPGIFDVMPTLRELYLSENKLSQITRGTFPNTLRLIRLNNNPWNCSCEMSDWKPKLINRIKRKVARSCDQAYDKGEKCEKRESFTYTYQFENKVAPKCATPGKFADHSVFHVMLREFRCTDYKPRIRKVFGKVETVKSTEKPTEPTLSPTQKISFGFSTEDTNESNDLKMEFLQRIPVDNFMNLQEELSANSVHFNGQLTKPARLIRKKMRRVYRKNINGKTKRVN